MNTYTVNDTNCLQHLLNAKEDVLKTLLFRIDINNLDRTKVISLLSKLDDFNTVLRKFW